MKKTLLLSVLMLALTLTASASKRIVVNLSQQRACAYNGSRAVFCGNISTGKPGHRTPTGYYRVLEKDANHVSSKYPKPNGGAKMHYMLRVTGSGIAMHLGHVPNYPASHGCIRMQNGFAQRMYRWAHVGVPISIIGTPPYRVSRSAYGRMNSGTRSRFQSPNDIMASFMGLSTHSRHRVKRSRTVRRSHARVRRVSRRRSTRSRRERHANALHSLASR